jgi:hypothetical protein
LRIPDVAMGMTAGLAAHQTMLGNALALEDPVMLARALLTYPMRPFSRDLSELYKTLFKLAGDEISPTYQQAVKFL